MRGWRERRREATHQHKLEGSDEALQWRLSARVLRSSSVIGGADTGRDSPCLLLSKRSCPEQRTRLQRERTAATQKERGRGGQRMQENEIRKRGRSFISLASRAHIMCATSIGSPPTAVAARERAARRPSARYRARSGPPSSPTRRLLDEARRSRISFQISMVQDETEKGAHDARLAHPLLNGPLGEHSDRSKTEIS